MCSLIILLESDWIRVYAVWFRDSISEATLLTVDVDG